MRARRVEIAIAIGICIAIILSYQQVSDVLVGAYAEYDRALLSQSITLRDAARPIVPLIVVLLALSYLRKRRTDLALWRLAAKLPIPDKLALSSITRFAERLLTSNYKLQRTGLKYIPDDTKVLLDVGWGGAVYLDNTSTGVTKIGLDINPKRLKVAQAYCIAIEHDIVRRGISNFKADAVVCFEVIEHLSDEEGIRLLKELENYPFVVLSTPREFFNVNRNGVERHKSFWNAERLKPYGYKLVEAIIVPPSNIYVRKTK